MSHTPGPWKVVRTKDEHWRERYYGIWTDEGVEKDRPIANVDGDNAVWLPEGEDFANARLIAAAPELLEACIEARSALDNLMGDSDLPEDDSEEMTAMQMLSAAIAKAEGESA
jgi:hypothetical protein